VTTEHDPDAIMGAAEKLILAAVDDPHLIPAYKLTTKQASDLEHSGWRRKNGMNQEHLILNFMRRNGSITVREAMIDLHIQSCTKRISELRALGHKITSVRKRHAVTGQTYVRYFLGDAPARP
jgi:hypothetical protein